MKPPFFTKTGQKLVFLRKKKWEKIMKLDKSVNEFHKKKMKRSKTVKCFVFFGNAYYSP